MQEVAFTALLCANCAPASHTTFPRGVLGQSAYTLALQALNSEKNNSSDGKSALKAPCQGSVPVPPRSSVAPVFSDEETGLLAWTPRLPKVLALTTQD